MTKQQINKDNKWAEAIKKYERTGELVAGVKAVTKPKPEPKFISKKQRRALNGNE